VNAVTDTLTAAEPTGVAFAGLVGVSFGPADSMETLDLVGFLRSPVRATTTLRDPIVPAVARSKKWSRIVAGLFFVSVAVGILVNRSLAANAYREIRNLSASSLVGLVLLVSIVKVFHTSMHWASLPDVPFRRVFQSTESYVGASNTVVGGAGLGTGLRVAMLRSWGVDPFDVAVSVIGTALAPSFALWGIAGAHTLPLVLTGRADNVERITACASVCFVVGPGLFWWSALRFPSVLAWVSRALHSATALLIAVIPSERLSKSLLARFDMPSHAEELRIRGAVLARSRGWMMIGASVCAQLSLGLLLIGCLQAVSPVPVSIDMLNILRAFALLRVLSSFVPIPAGLGVLDLGLLGVLTSGGAPRATALAAIAMYRALTFVLPMFTGSLCALAWRATQRRRSAVTPTSMVNLNVTAELAA
jgi:uncharacterized membrane protein YbhN (UPF0104 family)